MSYQPARLVVVQVDRCARIMSAFERIHNFFGDLFSKHRVITTATPDPSSATYTIGTSLCSS